MIWAGAYSNAVIARVDVNLSSHPLQTSAEINTSTHLQIQKNTLDSSLNLVALLVKQCWGGCCNNCKGFGMYLRKWQIAKSSIVVQKWFKNVVKGTAVSAPQCLTSKQYRQVCYITSASLDECTIEKCDVTLSYNPIFTCLPNQHFVTCWQCNLCQSKRGKCSHKVLATFFPQGFGIFFHREKLISLQLYFVCSCKPVTNLFKTCFAMYLCVWNKYANKEITAKKGAAHSNGNSIDGF